MWATLKYGIAAGKSLLNSELLQLEKKKTAEEQQQKKKPTQQANLKIVGMF